METSMDPLAAEGGALQQELTNDSTGHLAGRLWHYLHQHGRTSVIKLKSELQCTATELHLALGWLMREDKVVFLSLGGQLMVHLK